MAYRVVINGFGRVGRNVLRAFLERRNCSKDTDNIAIEFAAINDVADAEGLVHLFKYDSTHGTLPWPVKFDKEQRALCVCGLTIPMFQKVDVTELSWKALQVDLVLDCSGAYRHRATAERHLTAGAQRVVIGAAAFDPVDYTVVFGVNEEQLASDHRIISAASCTTNALANIIKPLSQRFSIDSVLVTEIHGYTTDQFLLDTSHADWRRARSATQSMIPTHTVGIEALSLVMPEMKGKVSGYSMRVPTINVAAVDVTLQLIQSATVDEINACLQAAATTSVNSIVEYNELPLVSCDFNHNAASVIVDLTQTQALGGLVKVVAWYDNEWGYANRLLDITTLLSKYVK